MENAVKALIFSATVLLAILIISLGIYIFNMSSNSSFTSATDTMSNLEITQYNNQYKLYEGVQKGSAVKTLLEMACQNNEKLYKESSTIKYCVCIRTNVRELLKEFSKDSEMTSGLNGSRDYGVRYPSNIKDLAKKISPSDRYKIWFKYNDDGIIWEINIDKP